LVTGGSGHLGANIVHHLVSNGAEVRVLVRRDSINRALDGLEVERAPGDLRDPDAVRRAVAGCGRIYHAAAIVSTTDAGPRQQRAIFETNVIGTRNLLAAARAAAVEKVVVSGSFSALGWFTDRPGDLVDETSLLYPFGRIMPYSRTKVLVEHECLRAFADGLPVVVAISTGIVGGHDAKPSRMGRSLCDYANGRLRFIVPGHHEFVAARDIVRGHVLAMARGRPGQSYTFSTAFLPLDEVIGHFARVAGDQGRPLRLPPSLMLPVAEVLSFATARLFPDREQRFTPGAIERLRHPRRADIGKAQSELGYAPSAIGDAFAEAYAFQLRAGRIRPRRTDPSRVVAAGEEPAQ
jgi:nucleoside-diphosphate-sugar epimerase